MMSLENNHNFRLDQMVWAKLSDNGGFWPAIISRDEADIVKKSWCIENDIHVQFVCPPFVRAYGQVMKERWINAYTELVPFELLKQSKILFNSNNISNAYREAVEIFKEGKALPRWVENVVITASKIKGCSIDDDDEANEGEEDDDADNDGTASSHGSSSSNQVSSSSVDQQNGHSSLPRGGPGKEGGSKINRKRKSRESFSSDSSLPDANQNKKMMRMPKRRTSQPIDSRPSQIVENGEVQEGSPHDTAYGQSDLAAMRFMVKTEKGWQCTECKFTPSNNLKQNLRAHVQIKHCDPIAIPCQYCEKVFKNLPSYRNHVNNCLKRAAHPIPNI